MKDVRLVETSPKELSNTIRDSLEREVDIIGVVYCNNHDWEISIIRTFNKCKRCSQPLPQIMPCDEWKKAGHDLRGQLDNLIGEY